MGAGVSVAIILDVKIADSDQRIRGFDETTIN
jgi:hypothetical protein